MTRQYKSMQEELMRRINTLETTIMERKDQLDLARQVPAAAATSPPCALTLVNQVLGCRALPLGCGCRNLQLQAWACALISLGWKSGAGVERPLALNGLVG